MIHETLSDVIREFQAERANLKRRAEVLDGVIVDLERVIERLSGKKVVVAVMEPETASPGSLNETDTCPESVRTVSEPEPAPVQVPRAEPVARGKARKCAKHPGAPRYSNGTCSECSKASSKRIYHKKSAVGNPPNKCLKHPGTDTYTNGACQECRREYQRKYQHPEREAEPESAIVQTPPEDLPPIRISPPELPPDQPKKLEFSKVITCPKCRTFCRMKRVAGETEFWTCTSRQECLVKASFYAITVDKMFRGAA